MESLFRAVEEASQTDADFFRSIVDDKIITTEEWSNEPRLANLNALAQASANFMKLDPDDTSTWACLQVVKQPGPVFVANAHNPIGVFHLRIVPHPSLHPLALRTWKIGDLNVFLIKDVDNNVGSSSKKRKRPTTPLSTTKSNAKNAQMSWHSSYTFDNFDVSVKDLSFPASGNKSVRLQFSCHAIDAVGRTCKFTTTSNCFTIISNCNQWKEGFEMSLRSFIFPDCKTHSSFSRFFNYLQLAYLYSKGFEETRYLDPTEIRNWLLNSFPEELRLDRDRQLLTVHDIVTIEIFEHWFLNAGPVLYDLHTSNVGKLFQKLWIAGFVGIGSALDCESLEEGQCRLNVDTSCESPNTSEMSYLMLLGKKTKYQLLALERDHLAYFFEHSRHSQDCTHLVSAVNPSKLLPVEEIYLKNNGKSGFGLSPTKKM